MWVNFLYPQCTIFPALPFLCSNSNRSQAGLYQWYQSHFLGLRTQKKIVKWQAEMKELLKQLTEMLTANLGSIRDSTNIVLVGNLQSEEGDLSRSKGLYAAEGSDEGDLSEWLSLPLLLCSTCIHDVTTKDPLRQFCQPLQPLIKLVLLKVQSQTEALIANPRAATILSHGPPHLARPKIFGQR